MKRYFLGMAAGYMRKARLLHAFAVGRKRDLVNLERYLLKRYGGEAGIGGATRSGANNSGKDAARDKARADGGNPSRAILCKNGRSALALALKAYFEPGEAVLVNGFTCYAVVEAVKAAGLVPVYGDISQEDLNFDLEKLGRKLAEMTDDEGAGVSQIRGIIVQNTFGNPIDIVAVEKLAKRYNLVVIEDLAHAAMVQYADGREAGTVGAAAVFSFGKDKAIDTVSGGAVILRHPCRNQIQAPSKTPHLADHLRARFYPLLAAVCRGLMRVRLGGGLMRFFVKLRLVERSADNRLDLERRLSKFEAKLALLQFRQHRRGGRKPIREFCLVEQRGKVLELLKKEGYYFSGFWYERPVSPERYYEKVHFPEKECENAVYVSEHILNLPNYYSKSELRRAREIMAEHAVRRGDSEGMDEAWEKVLAEYPEANFLQSPAYGRMNEMCGAKVVAEDFGGKGWALMIVRDAKRGRYLEIPCGPLIDFSNKELVEMAFQRIREVAMAEKCVFVRVRPQLLMNRENMEILENIGLVKAPMHLAAEHTVILDLTRSEDDMMAAMRRQTRYEVRRAQKMGIIVERGNSEELFREFHRVQMKTAERQGFVPPNLQTLLAEKEAFADDIEIYVARVDAEKEVKQARSKTPQERSGINDEATMMAEGEAATKGKAVAYGLIVKSGREADYYEAASTELNRKLPGAYALIWQAILDLKAEGYERFNLWGIAPPGQPEHRYAGVTTFKTGFGGDVVEYVPAHDLVISKVGYMRDLVVEKARKKRRHL